MIDDTFSRAVRLLIVYFLECNFLSYTLFYLTTLDVIWMYDIFSYLSPKQGWIKIMGSHSK